MNIHDHWMVLKVKSNREKIVEEDLKENHIAYYLPRVKKNKSEEKPLIPGYVFVKPGINQFEKMRYIRGSFGLICFNNVPGKMREKELLQLKRVVEYGSSVIMHKRLIQGAKIKVLNGVFEGVVGEFVNVENDSRICLQIDLLGNSVSTVLSKSTDFEIIK